MLRNSTVSGHLLKFSLPAIRPDDCSDFAQPLDAHDGVPVLVYHAADTHQDLESLCSMCKLLIDISAPATCA